jgi:hypothetical protein
MTAINYCGTLEGVFEWALKQIQSLREDISAHIQLIDQYLDLSKYKRSSLCSNFQAN